jgi:hypothetical protein
MEKAAILPMLLFGTILLPAQTPQDQAGSTTRRHAKEEVTVSGCVGRFSGDYILIQPEKGNIYELQGNRKLRLRPYLGQEVEVTGVETPSMSTTSDAGFGRLGSPSAATIVVHSIKSIAKRCSSY